MTNSGLQWAQPNMLKSPNKSKDLQEAPHADLTTAMGKSIEASIKAEQEITSEIIKSIDIGQKQREDIIDFWHKLAPKATGEIYEAAKNIKQNHELFGQVTKEYGLSKDPTNEPEAILARQQSDLIHKACQETGLLYEQDGDYVLADLSLDHNNYEQRKKIKATYMTSIRELALAQSSDLEFNIDGKIYTLGSEDTPPHIKKEIRRRIDVSVAGHLYGITDSDGNRLFSRNEINNDYLRKAIKANNELFVTETAAATEKAKVDLLLKKRQGTINAVNDGEPDAIQLAIDRHFAANPESKLSKSQIAENVVGDLLDLLDVPNGVDPLSLQVALTSPYKIGGKVWEGGLVEYFNDKNGSGDKWLDTIQTQLNANYKENENRLNALATKMGSDLLKRLRSMDITSARQEGIVLEQWLTELNAVVNDPNQDNQLLKERLPASVNAIITNGGMFETSEDAMSNIVNLLKSNKPVPRSEWKKLTPYHRSLVEEQFGKFTGFTSEVYQQEILPKISSVLNQNLISLYKGQTNLKGYDNQTKITNITLEFNELVMKELPNHIDKYETLEEAVRAAATVVMDDFSATYLVDLKKGSKEERKAKQAALIAKLDEMALPGFGKVRTEQEALTLVAEKSKFLKTVLSPTNFNKNMGHFNSSELLVGEDQSALQDKLIKWVNTGFRSEIPKLYKSWSERTGIPVEMIMILRANQLAPSIIEESQLKDFKSKINKFDPKNFSNEWIQQLNKADSLGEGVRVLVNPNAEIDGAIYERHYFPAALVLEANVEDKTKYDYIGTSSESTIFSEGKSLSEYNLNELKDHFDKPGAHYNIGAFGITNETMFNRILKRLYDKGLVGGDTLFDQKTQELFFREAAIMQTEREGQLNGYGWKVYITNNGDEQELNSCGLGDQQFSVTQAVFDACLANQNKK